MLKSSSIDGFGIIESLISIMLLTFLMVGGMSIYMYSNEHLKLMTYRRMAADLASSKMESIKGAGYAGPPVVGSCLPVDTTQQVGLLPASITACASLCNDGGNYSNYKQVEVVVQWIQPGQNVSSNVTLDSFIAQ